MKNCCGSKRRLPYTLNANTASSAHHISEPVMIAFRYTGRTGMSVTGGITGARYRFAHPGAEVLVDKRDAPGMGAVPNMERV